MVRQTPLKRPRRLGHRARMTQIVPFRAVGPLGGTLGRDRYISPYGPTWAAVGVGPLGRRWAVGPLGRGAFEAIVAILVNSCIVPTFAWQCLF